MKQIALTAATILVTGFVFAQTTKPKASAAPVTPLQFLGKTFEDCEKLIGKPSTIEDPKGEEKAFIRYYKPSLPNLTRFQLARGPDGAWDRPVATTVNMVTYFFPKGMLKTWRDAFILLGLNAEAGTPQALGATGIVRIEAPEFPKGWIQIQWTPSESTMTMPERYRRPNEDTLSFGGKLPPPTPVDKLAGKTDTAAAIGHWHEDNKSLNLLRDLYLLPDGKFRFVRTETSPSTPNKEYEYFGTYKIVGDSIQISWKSDQTPPEQRDFSLKNDIMTITRGKLVDGRPNAWTFKRVPEK